MYKIFARDWRAFNLVLAECTERGRKERGTKKEERRRKREGKREEEKRLSNRQSDRAKI